MKLFLQSPIDYYFPRLSKVLVGCALGMLIVVPVLLLGVPLGWWAYTAITQALDASHRAAAPLSLEERAYYEQRLAELQRRVAEEAKAAPAFRSLGEELFGPPAGQREAFRARPVPPATAAPGEVWMQGIWPPQGNP